MKRLVTLIFGIDEGLYSRLSASGKKQYYTKLLALLISIFMASIVSVEITHSVIGEFNPKIIVPVTVVWMLLVAAMDILLLRKATPPIFRLFFSIALVVASVVLAFTSLSRKDLTNNINSISDVKIRQLDSTYLANKISRYKEYADKKEEIANYHDQICKPEALNVRPAEQYNLKHTHCVTEEVKLNTIKTTLDNDEALFKSRYDQEKEKINAKAITTLGISEQIEKTLEYVFASPVRIGAFIIIAIMLLSLESIVFFTSLNIKDDELEELKLKQLENTKAINIRELNTDKADKEYELDNLDKFKNLNRKMKELLLLKHIAKEYKGFFKTLQPDLKTPKTSDESLGIQISNSISNLQHEIEETLDFNASVSTGNTLTNNSGDAIADDKNLEKQYYNTFYCTAPMKKLADELWAKSKHNTYRYSKALFNWCLDNIQYQETHALDHYKTSRETWNSRVAICGEMSIFFNAMLKYKGIQCNYIHVDVNDKADQVNHACSGLKINDKMVLVDVAYQTFDISHQKWNVVTDEDLILNMQSWNQ